MALLAPVIANVREDSGEKTKTSSTSSSSTSTTIADVSDDSLPSGPNEVDEWDAAIYEPQTNDTIDAAVGKKFVSDQTVQAATAAYPFTELWPERATPIRRNFFEYGIFDTFNYGGGIWQSPYISSSQQTKRDGLSCAPRGWTGLMACGIASTEYGRFQIVVTRSEPDALNFYRSDDVDITVYIEAERAGKKYVYSVLKAHLTISKCVPRMYSGEITLKKIRVGANDVFVLATNAGYRQEQDFDQFTSDSERDMTVIAMTPSGMPEVVAGYEIGELQQVAATDRSLILTSGAANSGSDENSPFGTGEIIELIPSPQGWKERIHPLASGKDPLWAVANIELSKSKSARGLGIPLTLLDYTSLTHASEYDTYCFDYEE